MGLIRLSVSLCRWAALLVVHKAPSCTRSAVESGCIHGIVGGKEGPCADRRLPLKVGRKVPRLCLAVLLPAALIHYGGCCACLAVGAGGLASACSKSYGSGSEECPSLCSPSWSNCRKWCGFLYQAGARALWPRRVGKHEGLCFRVSRAKLGGCFSRPRSLASG